MSPTSRSRAMGGNTPRANTLRTPRSTRPSSPTRGSRSRSPGRASVGSYYQEEYFYPQQASYRQGPPSPERYSDMPPPVPPGPPPEPLPFSTATPDYASYYASSHAPVPPTFPDAPATPAPYESYYASDAPPPPPSEYTPHATVSFTSHQSDSQPPPPPPSSMAQR